jgi:hypothetical protein
VRGPTSVSKLNPDNVYSIQSDEASVVCGGGGGEWGLERERERERGGNISHSVGVALK